MKINILLAFTLFLGANTVILAQTKPKDTKVVKEAAEKKDAGKVAATEKDKADKKVEVADSTAKKATTTTITTTTTTTPDAKTSTKSEDKKTTEKSGAKKTETKPADKKEK